MGSKLIEGWDESDWGLPAADERRLAYAALVGLSRKGEATGSDDIERVGKWAASLMRGAAIVELLIAGKLVPVGFKGDEPCFAPAEHALTSEQLDGFRRGLKVLEWAELSQN